MQKRSKTYQNTETLQTQQVFLERPHHQSTSCRQELFGELEAMVVRPRGLRSLRLSKLQVCALLAMGAPAVLLLGCTGSNTCVLKLLMP